MIFFTDTHFIHESSNKFNLNIIYFTKRLIITTLTNKPISTKLDPNNSHFLSAMSINELNR